MGNNKYKILIVEDEANIRELLRLYLVTPIDLRSELPRTPDDMQ